MCRVRSGRVDLDLDVAIQVYAGRVDGDANVDRATASQRAIPEESVVGKRMLAAVVIKFYGFPCPLPTKALTTLF